MSSNVEKGSDYEFPDVGEFVSQMDKDVPYLIPHLVTMWALDRALIKYQSYSPIANIDPITYSLIVYINRKLPNIPSILRSKFRFSVNKYISQNGYMDKYIEFSDRIE
jgi:hypothetical protein